MRKEGIHGGTLANEGIVPLCPEESRVATVDSLGTAKSTFDASFFIRLFSTKREKIEFEGIAKTIKAKHDAVMSVIRSIR